MAWRYCQVHCNVSEGREMDLLYAMVKLHHPLNAIVHFRFYVCLQTRCHSRSKLLHACPWLSCPWPCVNFYKLAMLLKRCLALSRHQNGKCECILAAVLLNDAPFPLFSQCRLLWTLLHRKRAFQLLWSMDKRAFSRTSGWTFRHPWYCVSLKHGISELHPHDRQHAKNNAARCWSFNHFDPDAIAGLDTSRYAS